MAKFRKVHTSFWDDSFVEQLSPEDRYFYLFLMTNPLCTECGIYFISVRKMSYYTGYNDEAIKGLINRFVSKNRIVYDTSTDEICILKKPNYIDRLGKPVLDCLNSELDRVKNKSLIFKQLRYIVKQEIRDVYDTWAISRQEKEKEEEKEIKKERGDVPSPPPSPSSLSGYNQLPDGRSYIDRDVFFVAADFNGLPEDKSISIKSLLSVVKKIEISEDELSKLWEVFKTLNLTFQKPYRNKDDVYNHFSNWCKTQTFSKSGRGTINPKKETSKVNGKVIGVEFIENFTKCKMSDGSVVELDANQSSSAQYLGMKASSITKS